MSESRLTAETRTEFGKGAARRIRRAGKIPAVMYGHGAAPVHITLPGHDSMMALKHTNALLTIVLEGNEQLALAKDVQRDPIKPVIDHVDLVVVRKGEKVTVDVPVVTEGDAASETVVTVEAQTISLLVEATAIPESLIVDITGLSAGVQVKAADVTLPGGSELAGDPEQLVVNITAMISQEALDAELTSAEPEADAGPSEAAAAADADTPASSTDAE